MSSHKFTGDVVILGLIQAILLAKAFLVLPVITKLLGPQDYGTWIQILVTINLITPMATLGLSYALVRFLAAENNKENIRDGFYSAIFTVLISACIAGSSIFFFSNPISNFFDSSRILVQILAVAVIFECLNDVLFNYFRSFQQIGKYFVFFSFQAGAEVVLVITSVFLGYGLFGAVLSLLAIRIVNFLAMGTFVISKIGFAFPHFSQIKDYLHFGLPTIPGNISSWVTQSSDRFLISFFLGTVFVGYYAPAYTIASSIALFIAPLSFLLPAVLSKLFDEKNIATVKAYLQYSLKFYLAAAIPSVFGLVLLSKQLLILFSTPEIAAQSYKVIPFVATGIALFGVYVIFSQIFVIFKKTHALGSVWISAAIVYLLLDILLIPALGIVGAAITNCLTFFVILSAVCCYSYKKIKFGFKIEWDFIGKSIAASIIMAVAIACLKPATILSMLASIGGGAILYTVFLFLLGGISKKEIHFLKSNIPKLFSGR